MPSTLLESHDVYLLRKINKSMLPQVLLVLRPYKVGPHQYFYGSAPFGDENEILRGTKIPAFHKEILQVVQMSVFSGVLFLVGDRFLCSD